MTPQQQGGAAAALSQLGIGWCKNVCQSPETTANKWAAIRSGLRQALKP
jgi:hypothetical protein